ncbi:diguanylate cyclase domain-containing protein [Paenibacillus hexagrammi]|uniref:Diguanylate cyclase n=1 Tax=Paenibacillus hexagrammi TaxID=2908839 RepID=A0ABY3SP66_9BACL|nr:diguanylate cyclase [Paenibacillus sp. YPD9-1]UJF35494.1 diguanylate cyclase [Paenibacillus sp. YPD9-1]
MIFTLRKRLYISFLIIIMMFIATSAVTTLLSQRIVRLSNDILISSSRMEVIQRLNLFARTANDNGAHYLLAPLYVEDTFKSDFDAAAQFVDEEILRLSALTTDPVSLGQLDEFKVKWSAYVQSSQKIIALKKTGLVTVAQESFTKDSFDPIAFSLHGFYENEQSRIEAYQNEIERSSHLIGTVNLFMAATAVVASLMIALILSNYLIRRIDQLRTSTQTVARGDWQVDALHFKGKDELSDLADAFNTMTHSLRNLMNSNQTLQQLSMRDGLTGIANRRSYDEALEREWSRLTLTDKPLSLILMDIDYFKKYNDLYGHQTGDKCLIQVAAVLSKQVMGPYEVVARYGGEEFAVILPEQTEEQAVQVAKRIQQALMDTRIPHKNSEISEFVTLSIGISTMKPAPQILPATLLAQADKALYQAKETGRNQYYLYQSDPVDIPCPREIEGEQ